MIPLSNFDINAIASSLLLNLLNHSGSLHSNIPLDFSFLAFLRLPGFPSTSDSLSTSSSSSSSPSSSSS